MIGRKCIKKNPITQETKNKISKTLKEKHKTGELQSPMKNKKHRPESIKKLKNRIITDQHRKNISQGRNRQMSVEGYVNPNLGRSPSEETRAKWSIHRKGMFAGSKNPSSKKIQCVESGMIFDCIKYACEYYNISRHQISQRIKQGLLSYII